MYQTSAETDHSHVSKHADPDWCVPTQMFGTWQEKGITTADWLACTLCKSLNMLILAGVLAVKRILPLMQFMQWGRSHELAGCRVCIKSLRGVMATEKVS